MAPSGTIIAPEKQQKTLPPPQAHRSAGTGLLIAIVIVLIVLFALVAWSRYHRTQQPPTAPMHQNSQVLGSNYSG